MNNPAEPPEWMRDRVHDYAIENFITFSEALKRLEAMGLGPEWGWDCERYIAAESPSQMVH